FRRLCRNRKKGNKYEQKKQYFFEIISIFYKTFPPYQSSLNDDFYIYFLIMDCNPLYIII
ncbi:MAG: hypothetical protein ABRQ39_19320, partial [Candidatus Eremiobacterota bacterium]